MTPILKRLIREELKTGQPLRKLVSAYRANVIEFALAEKQGNICQTAKVLRTHRNRVHDYLRQKRERELLA